MSNISSFQIFLINEKNENDKIKQEIQNEI